MVSQRIDNVKNYLSDHLNDSPSKIALYVSIFMLLLITGITILQVQRRQDQQSGAAVSTFALSNCEVSSSDLSFSGTEQDMFTQVNQYRQQNGVPALSRNTDLERAAAWKTRDMEINGYGTSAHIDTLGRDPTQRGSDCGFNGLVAENAGNSSSVTGMLNWWKGSDGHNRLLLKPEFKVAGVSNTGNMWIIKFSQTEGNVATTPTNTPVPPQTTQPPPTNTPTQPPANPSPSGPAASPTPPGPTPTSIPEGSTTILKISASVTKVVSPVTLPVTIKIFDTDNREVITSDIPLQYAQENTFKGEMNAGVNLPTGFYSIKIKSGNTLQENIDPFLHKLENKKTIIIPTVKLTQGDLNDDNVLSVADIQVLFACLNNIQCKEKDSADLNFDGKLNMQDYSTMLENFKSVSGS